MLLVIYGVGEMREIKFRVWNSDEQKMFIGHNIYGKSEPDATFKQRSTGAFTRLWEALARLKEARYCKLMQYTGLKDKNGKEIYEGDIMHVHWTNGFSWGTGYLKGEVIFQKGAFAIRRHESDHYYFCNFKHIDELTEFKVIGNIYENPELMKNETKE